MEQKSKFAEICFALLARAVISRAGSRLATWEAAGVGLCANKYYVVPIFTVCFLLPAWGGDGGWREGEAEAEGEKRQSLSYNVMQHVRNRTNPETEAEPQQIVAQRLLSCLQYPVPIKSSTEDLTRPTFCLAVK